MIGLAFSDPMGRMTFFAFDARLKEAEKVLFRTIQEMEGALSAFLEKAGGEPVRAPISMGPA